MKLQREINLLGVEKDSCGHDGPMGECLVCSGAGRPAVAVGGLESEVEIFWNELASILYYEVSTLDDSGRRGDSYGDCEI